MVGSRQLTKIELEKAYKNSKVQFVVIGVLSLVGLIFALLSNSTIADALISVLMLIIGLATGISSSDFRKVKRVYKKYENQA